MVERGASRVPCRRADDTIWRFLTVAAHENLRVIRSAAALIGAQGLEPEVRRELLRAITWRVDGIATMLQDAVITRHRDGDGR